MKKNKKSSNVKNGKIIPRLILFVFMIIIAATTVYPVFFTLISSLKTQADWSKSKFGLPNPVTFVNYATAWKRAKVPQTFLNSMIVTVGGIFLCFFVCILASFSVTKMKYKGRNIVFLVLISSLMIPMQTILYSFFQVMTGLNLVDKHFGLILAFATFQIPVTVYQYSAYIKRIPTSIVEAAKIDGASYFVLLFRIIVPIAKPVIFTAGLVSFAWMWNDILLPIMVMQSPKSQTLIVALSSLKGQYGTFPTLICAGAFLGIFPVSVFYLVFQRQLISGITSGALKE